MTELIKVKAADPERCALWERHPDQPDGEVFVYGEQVFEVANTPLVQQRLRDGALLLVEDTPVVEETPKVRKAKA